MTNLTLFGIFRIPFFPVVKSFTCTLLTLLFILTPLLGHAGNGPGGPGGPGPGPGAHNGNQGQEMPGHGGQHDPDWQNFYGVENLAYYGDWNANRVFVIDIDNMTLLKPVINTGDGPYGCDQQNQETAYALTRKTESLTVIENYYIENIGKIFLEHKPRSTAFNSSTGLSLVSGADKVMTSIIDVENDSVLNVLGSDVPAIPGDFGGSLATGHPFWFSANYFFMLDRANRQIQLWDRSGGLLSVLDTPTSVHHIFRAPKHEAGTWFAVVEGDPRENRSPSILRFRVFRGKMTVTGEAILSDYDPGSLDPAVMGSHHAAFHPDAEHIYVGSAEGHVFVVNRYSMQIISMIETGRGSGHTTFVPEKDLAFVTNHNDEYMTVIDTKTHSFLKNIWVASTADPSYKSQAHTSGVSPDSKYFYSAASHDGVFFEIDTDTLEVTRFLDLNLEYDDDGPVNILMGSIVWGSVDGGGGM